MRILYSKFQFETGFVRIIGKITNDNMSQQTNMRYFLAIFVIIHRVVK